ncbi:hypothetical protein ACTWPV_28975, partial [Nonomuraea sp. KM88]
EEMLLAAAGALAAVVTPEELGPNYIIPSVFHPDVSTAVAAAVHVTGAHRGPSSHNSARGRKESWQ